MQAQLSVGALGQRWSTLLVLVAMWAGWALAGAAQQPGAADLERRLGELEAATRSQVPELQRGVGDALGEASAPLLIDWLKRGDTEFRGRLAGAFDARPPHLRLAAQLAERPEEAAAELGRAALSQAVAGWRPGLQTPALEGGQLRLRLDELERAVPFARWSSAGVGSAESVLDQLVRTSRPPIDVVLDPDLARTGRELRLPLGRGTWRTLLEDFALEVGGRWHAVTAEAEGPLEPRPVLFLWLRPNGSTDARVPSEHLSAWVRQLVGAERDEDRRVAARALACCGWPAGMALLGSLANAGEAAAIEGLAVAASRGRTVREAHSESVRQAWLAAAMAAPQGRSAHPWICALGELGRRAPDGGDHLPEFLQQTVDSQGRERQLRMEVLGRWRAWTPGLRDLLAEELSRPPEGPVAAERLRLALDAWFACAPIDTPAPSVPHASELWQGLRFDAVACGQLGRQLGVLGVAPPESWRTSQGLPKPFGVRARAGVVAWWLELGELELAFGHLDDFKFDARKPAHLEALWASLGRAGRVDGHPKLPELVALGGRGKDADSIDVRERKEALELALGVAPPWTHGERLERLDALTPGHMKLIACLAAGPAGELARGRLLDTARHFFDRGGEDPGGQLAAAVELAVGLMAAEGMDSESSQFMRALGVLVRQNSQTELSAKLLVPDFARPPGVVTRDIERADAALGR